MNNENEGTRIYPDATNSQLLGPIKYALGNEVEPFALAGAINCLHELIGRFQRADLLDSKTLPPCTTKE